MIKKLTIENLKDFGMTEPEGELKHLYALRKALVGHEDGDLDLVVTMQRNNTPELCLKMPGATILLRIRDISDLKKLQQLIVGFDIDY